MVAYLNECGRFGQTLERLETNLFGWIPYPVFDAYVDPHLYKHLQHSQGNLVSVGKKRSSFSCDLLNARTLTLGFQGSKLKVPKDVWCEHVKSIWYVSPMLEIKFMDKFLRVNFSTYCYTTLHRLLMYKMLRLSRVRLVSMKGKPLLHVLM